MTQTLEQKSTSNLFDEWAREKAKTRVYPEPCPSKCCEVDFDKARYIINGKEFNYVPKACGCHADIQRQENGISYTIEPGTEKLASIIYNTLVGSIEEINKKEKNKMITGVRLQEIFNILSPAGITKTGEVNLSQQIFDKLPDEVKREQLKDILHHEAGHRKYDYQGPNNFQNLWENAINLKIIDYFKDSNFYDTNKQLTSFAKSGGHPDDTPTELYASAYMISERHKPEFYKRFYDNLNPTQKKLVDTIFQYVESKNKQELVMKSSEDMQTQIIQPSIVQLKKSLLRKIIEVFKEVV